MKKILFYCCTFVFSVMIIACSWQPTSSKEDDKNKDRIREKLPDWYEEVWKDGFSEAQVSNFSYEDSRLFFVLELNEDISDYTTSVDEALALLDRNDNYANSHQLDKLIDISIEIQKSVPRCDDYIFIGNDYYMSGKASTKKTSLKGLSKSYNRYVDIYSANCPTISVDIEDNIGLIFIGLFTDEMVDTIPYIKRFTNVDALYIDCKDESLQSEYSQFVSDMEERGVEVITD